MLNKFEELYNHWRGYFNEALKMKKEIEERKKNFAEKAQKQTDEENFEEIYEINATAQKSNHDMNILSIKVKTVFDLIEDKSSISKEVIRDMEELELPKPFYIYKESKLYEVNPELHTAMRNNFEQIRKEQGERN